MSRAGTTFFTSGEMQDLAIYSNLSTSSILAHAQADGVAPIISSIASSTTQTTATITWTTDQAASSTVAYGLTISYGIASTSASLVTSHSIVLSGLTPSTTYHFQVGGADSIGTVSTSTDKTFTTASSGIVPPTVTVQSATSVATSSATLNGTITSLGNAPSSTVEGFNYGLTASYGTVASTSGTFSTGSFSQSISGLSPGTLYHYQAFAVNSGGTGTSSDQIFNTPPQNAFLYDAFNDTNGILLENHIGQTGATWSKAHVFVSGSAQIYNSGSGTTDVYSPSGNMIYLASGIATSSTYTLTSVQDFESNVGTSQGLAFGYNSTATNGYVVIYTQSVGQYQLYRSSSSTFTLLASYSFPFAVGYHTLAVHVSGTSTITVTATVDGTQGINYTDTSPPSGDGLYCGLWFNTVGASTTTGIHVDSIMGTSSTSTYSIAANPTTLIENTTGNSVLITGTNTAWTAGTPGSPAFTLSGGSGASITAQAVTSSSSATLTITAGSSTGTLTITDPSTGATTNVSVTASSSLSLGTASLTSAGASALNLSVGATSGGVAPYTYQWYRSATAGFTPGAGNLLSNATATSIADTPPSNNTWFYKVIATDSSSNSTTSNQVGATLESPTITQNSISSIVPTTLSILNIGDSITYGYGLSAGQDPVTQMGIALSNMLGTRAVTVTNAGVNGSQTSGWLPGSGTGYLTSAMSAAQSASPAATIAMITLGANDGATGHYVASTTYASNLSTIISYLLSNGFSKVILNHPTYIPSGANGGATSEESTLLTQQYMAQIDSLINGTTILAGDTTAYPFFSDNLNDLQSDHTHPTATGAVALGTMWATAAVKNLGITLTPITSFSGKAGQNSTTTVIALSGWASTGSQTVTLTSNNSSDVLTASSTTGSGSITYTLPIGTSFIPYIINRSTIGTSNISVTNAQGWTNPSNITYSALSSDATLSNLTISSGTLSPIFSSATTSYTDSVANGVSSITVTPTANQGASSTITVSVNSGTPVSVASGATSTALSLSVGSNTISILVTAPDGVTTSTYTLAVTRAVATYTLLYSAGANGTITGTSTQTVAYGSNGTAVTAVPSTGYHFVDWSDASTTNPRTDSDVIANVTVSAIFATTNVLTITSFSLSATSTSLTVPITSFTTGETVAGYFLNESSTTPSSTTLGWTSTVPVSYAFQQAGSSRTLYAWVKDGSGNVSSPASATVSFPYYAMPSGNSVQTLVLSGIVTSTASSVASTTAITFNDPVQVSIGASTVSIPSGTIMTTASSSDFTTIVATTTVATDNLPANSGILGTVQYGLTSSSISLSQAITITIPVDSSYDGQTLPVYQSEDGGTTWTEITTCLITSGICSFTTSNLSSFAVIVPTITTPSATPGVVVATGGGGSAYAIYIDNGVATTTTPSVTLSLYSTGAYTMELSNTSNFASSTWIPYVTSMPWTLAPSTGEQTVFVQYRAVSGSIIGNAQASIDLAVPSTSTMFSTSGMSIAQMENFLASLEAQLKTLESQASLTASFTFTRNLSLWSTGNDVEQLQQFLISQNSGTAARKLAAHGATKTFGMLTFNALVEFQKSVAITPASGYFGAITRKYVTSL
jgi:lysophospholipase L1-like esterase